MPTPIDKALNSKNAVLAFGALIATVAAWSIWGSDMFPTEPDPTSNPDTWTREECRRWLAKRDLHPQSGASREQLLERIKANMR